LLGRFGGNTILEKWGKRLHLTKNLIEKLEEYFKNHSVKTLIITRMTWGFSMLSFMTAGSLKMKFKKFLIINLVTAIAWIFALVSIGYVFGARYKALSTVTKSIRIGLTIALFAIIVFLSDCLLAETVCQNKVYPGFKRAQRITIFTLGRRKNQQVRQKMI
jgi:membrane protein DedA with SNARE-associated domain